MKANTIAGIDAPSSLSNPPSGPTYKTPAKLLHWITVLLMLAAVPIGAILHDLPRVPATFFWYNLHKSLGATIFIVVVLRLLYRWRNPPPELPGSMPPWQHTAAVWVHRAIYALLLAQPIVGWMASQAGGHPLKFWGWFAVPAPVPASKELNVFLHQIHSVIGWTLVALIAIHILAALKHAIVDRDRVLDRMIGRSGES